MKDSIDKVGAARIAARSPVKGIYAVLDSGLLKPEETEAAAREVLEAGAGVLQLRAKGWPSGTALAAARRIKEAADERGALFILNDRVDLALLSGADGVHLGQDDLPIAEARRLFAGKKAVIGVSTHNVEEAKMAEADGADYISLGPVFNTTTKKDAQSPKGVEALRAVKAAVRVPVVAIGGITESNVPEVIEAGADAAAIISDILTAPDRKEKVKRLIRLWADAQRRRVPTTG